MAYTRLGGIPIQVLLLFHPGLPELCPFLGHIHLCQDGGVLLRFDLLLCDKDLASDSLGRVLSGHMHSGSLRGITPTAASRF